MVLLGLIVQSALIKLGSWACFLYFYCISNILSVDVQSLAVLMLVPQSLMSV